MKKTTLLFATPDDRYIDFEESIQAQFTHHASDQVEIIFLRRLHIEYCTGCWDCWVKTPGLCPINDDMSSILSAIMRSEQTIIVSPISMDFVPALLKKTCDRIIPLVHPYIEVYKNELHHKNRYAKYPTLGLIIIDPEKNTERFDVIRDIFQRLSINMKTQFEPALMIGPDEQEELYAVLNN